MAFTEENIQKQFQIDQGWSFHTMKWLKNGMVILFINQSMKKNIHS